MLPCLWRCTPQHRPAPGIAGAGPAALCARPVAGRRPPTAPRLHVSPSSLARTHRRLRTRLRTRLWPCGGPPAAERLRRSVVLLPAVPLCGSRTGSRQRPFPGRQCDRGVREGTRSAQRRTAASWLWGQPAGRPPPAPALCPRRS